MRKIQKIKKRGKKYPRFFSDVILSECEISLKFKVCLQEILQLKGFKMTCFLDIIANASEISLKLKCALPFSTSTSIAFIVRLIKTGKCKTSPFFVVELFILQNKNNFLLYLHTYNIAFHLYDTK